MKSKQYLLSVILLLLTLSLLPSKAKADHCAGGELIYEWISDSTYRFTFKFYRDCTGIDAYADQQLCMWNSCNPTATTSAKMDKWVGQFPDGRQNGDPVAAGCSGYPTVCEGASTIPGYREWWYTALVTIPYSCNFWRFGVSVSARNFSNNIPGGYLYLETEFDNQHFQGNSSPYFSVPPVPYVCVNQPTTYNNGAIDADGDSLVTDILQPRSGGTCDGTAANLPFNAATPAYSVPGNPIQTNGTFTVNGVTGGLNFTPAMLGPGTITVRTKEYRHGVLVGSIMRDVQIQVLDCSTIAPVVSPDPGTVSGGAYDNNRINGCAGSPLQFDFVIKSSASDNILIGTDNHIFSFPKASVTYAHQRSDSVRGTFAWNTTTADTGLRSLLVTVKDSTCKPPGILIYQVFTLPIYIWPATVAVPDTAICPEGSAFLSVSGGGNFEWSVLPGGGPITSLSCTSCKSTVATTNVKTTYVVESKINPYCPRNKDTVTVDLLPGLVFTPMQDTVTCIDNPVKLDPKGNPPASVTYLYKWTPSTYIGDSTKKVVTSIPKTPTTYTLVITSTANQCKGYDTVVVDVLTGFKIDNIDTAICDGQTVDVRGAGDSRYTINWTNASLANGVFNDPKILTPTITPLNIGKDRYKITLSKTGCRDSSFDFQIDKQPIPQVKVDDDAKMCFGDTMQMNGVILPANYPFDLTWTPGSSLTNPKIANPIFNATQNTTLILTAKTKEAGCTSQDTVVLEVFPAAFLTASNDTGICPGGSAQLHVSGKGVKSFRWVPDIRISDAFSFDPIVSPPASTEYKVYAVDVNFCSDTQKVMVTVYPKATIHLPDSVKIYPGESYHLEPGGNCSYYSWFPPLGLTQANIANPVAMPEVNTRYFVTGTTEAGCTASDSINVLVSTESIIDLPNGFIPGSSTNGKFKILHMGTATLKNFSIYNRWGVKVYESTDLNEGWDGSYKNDPQPMGVYIYTVEAVTPTGRKFTKQGNVTLVR